MPINKQFTLGLCALPQTHSPYLKEIIAHVTGTMQCTLHKNRLNGLSGTGAAMIATYSKIADSVVDEGLGPYAGWLYTVIVRHMNRKTNELRKTVKELATLANMSSRSVIRYTKLLEAKNLLNVIRNQDGDVADINVYQLCGESAQISLFNGVPNSHKASDSQSQAPAERHVPQSHRKESNTQMNTPNDSVCVPDWVLSEIKSFEGINPDWPIRTYGAARVLAVVRYAKRNHLRIGWVITELREDRMAIQPADISKPHSEWDMYAPEPVEDKKDQDQAYKQADPDDTTEHDFDDTEEQSDSNLPAVGKMPVFFKPPAVVQKLTPLQEKIEQAKKQCGGAFLAQLIAELEAEQC